MSLRADFDQYLSHLGETVPVSALHHDPDSPSLCALRHDVDWDLDMALETAHREHEKGVRASYFVLPTAPYWSDARLIEKCLQIQDYGHEVGLHANCMAEWMDGRSNNPESTLRSQLARLRDGGIAVHGVSSHGDRLCYQHNVSNYWCFRELRPECPVRNESGRSAEGPVEPDGSATRLQYPDDDEVVRADGMRLRLWSISLSSLGLEYHAWHTPFDRYFSDSGGSWTRTPDPLTVPRGEERWQVLMHPIYWRGPRRLYFFLSTARSGSRWLTEVLDQATPFEARHEYILNQDFHRGEAVQKATASFRALEDDPDTVRARLSEAWEELEQLKHDYAEVNVYLPSFVEELRRYFPDAVFIHLHRNPAEVVRSLMDRDWYDTPEDPVHPGLRDIEPSSIGRFERICHHVSEVNDRLVKNCSDSVGLNELTRSPDSLKRELRRVGISFYPRLGNHLVTTVINAARRRELPSPEQWSVTQKRSFDRICGSVATKLRYPLLEPSSTQSRFELRKHLDGWIRRCSKLAARLRYPGNPSLAVDRARFNAVNCEILSKREGTVMCPHSGDRHSYLTLAGSRWRSLRMIGPEESGWKVVPGRYVVGKLSMRMLSDTVMSVFAISYAADGEQVHCRRVGLIDGKKNVLDFAFTPQPDSSRFDIGIYCSASTRERKAIVEECVLCYRSSPC